MEINCSPDIDFQDFMNLYKKYTAKLYFLVNDTILALDNALHFRLNFLEGIKKLIITSDDKLQ